MPSKAKRRKTAPRVAGAAEAAKAAASVASVDDPESSITEVGAILRGKVCGRTPPLNPKGIADEERQLKVLLEASVCRGESNSVLLIGPRGCGKTLVVERALSAVASVPEAAARGHYVVRLNGLLHNDDNVALKELARQIEEQTALFGGGGATASEQAAVKKRVSTADTVRELLDALRAGTRATTRCLVVVLDEFDLFAHPGKQSLLYTLLDTAQANLTPLAVVGVTARFDAEELLEKRVLSRFSRRKIYLYNTLTFADYTYTFRELLTLPADAAVGGGPDFVKRWNADVATFSESAVVAKELARLYDTNRDIRALQRLALFPVARLSRDAATLSARALFDGAVTQRLDAKAAVLVGLSVLELCLVIAMANHAADNDDAFNFEIIYQGYRDFVLQDGARTVEWYSKPVAFKAYEHLIALELVRRADAGRAKNTPKRFQGMRLMLEPTQVREVLQRYPRIPTHVAGWLKAA